jgi:Forkhead domain
MAVSRRSLLIRPNGHCTGTFDIKKYLGFSGISLFKERIMISERGSAGTRGGKKIPKNVTYSKMIIEAIDSSPEGRCTSSQIFEHLSKTYPDQLTEERAHVWKNSVRQLLSKEHHFIKLGKKKGEKYNEWVYFPLNIYSGGAKKRGAEDLRREDQGLRTPASRPLDPGPPEAGAQEPDTSGLRIESSPAVQCRKSGGKGQDWKQLLSTRGEYREFKLRSSMVHQKTQSEKHSFPIDEFEESWDESFRIPFGRGK